MISHRIRPVGRRDLLGLAATAVRCRHSVAAGPRPGRRRRLGDRSGRTTRQRPARGDEGGRKHTV